MRYRRAWAFTGAAAGLMLVASPPMFTNLDKASAQAIAESAQLAEDARTYRMPSGDFGVAAQADGKLQNLVEVPRRIPISEAQLRRIKGGAAKRAEAAPEISTAADSAVNGADPEPQAVLQNCETNVATGFAPSDIHGAAGPINLVVVTNVDIGVYNKSTCGIVSRVSLRTFFSQNGGFTIPSSETLFDPRVLYDRLNGRCLALAESRDSTNTDQFLYVAGSTDSSCTSWRRKRIVLSKASTGKVFCKNVASDFYDYPNAGYNIRRLVVTSNNFPSGGGAYGTLLSIDSQALYGTDRVRAKCLKSSLPFNMAPAVVGDVSDSMFILSPGSGSGSSIRRFRLDTSASGPRSDQLFEVSAITIPFWQAPPDAAQPNGQRLDTLDGRFQGPSKQIDSLLWNVHAVAVSGFSRWRLYKLSTTGTSVLFSFTPTTTTSGCTDADHLFNPSVDIQAASTSALAYVTASRTCPAASTVGRAAMLIFRGPNSSSVGWAFDTISTSTAEYQTDGFGTPCNNTSRGSCRWGDYSSTQIDPSSTSTAWGFNQLITGTTQFNWTTRGAQAGP